MVLSDNTFSGNTAGNGGAMYVTAESSVIISDNAFTHNRAICDGGAIYSKNSNIGITGSTKNSSILSSEGYCRTCDMITTIPKSIPYEEVIMELNEALCATHFTNNTATRHGGAMLIDTSTVLFQGSVIMFRYNSANDSGGALNIFKGSRVTSSTHQLFFSSNRALRTGGSVAMKFSDFHTEVSNIYFLNNSAGHGGAGINYIGYKSDISILLSGSSYFLANRAEWGSGIYTLGNFTITGSAFFIENTATYGGAIYTYGNFIALGEINFVNNTAWNYGGAMYIVEGINLQLNNVSAIANSNSALCIFQSNVTFTGTINFSNNTGTDGGGIQVIYKNSHLYFTGSTVFYGNKAGLGGAMYLPFGAELTFSGDTLFSHNTADTNGGAIYSMYNNIIFDRNSVVLFKWNRAENGGAIYLTSSSFLTFNNHVNLSIFYNHATKYGGGIYHEDVATVYQCSFKRSEETKPSLPYCFIGFNLLNISQYYPTLIFSRKNSADISGSFLHGGLLDKCQLEQTTTLINILDNFFRIQENNHEITSKP